MQKVKRINVSGKQFRNVILSSLPATLRCPPHTLVTSQPKLGAVAGAWPLTDKSKVMTKGNAYRSRAIVEETELIVSKMCQEYS
jgi:hypothetical protein